MVNTTRSSKADIWMNKVQLEEVQCFKKLGTTFSKYVGCAADVHHELCKSVVVPIMMYGCKTWTMLTESEQRIKAFEMKWFRRLLRILLQGAKDKRLYL